ITGSKSRNKVSVGEPAEGSLMNKFGARELVVPSHTITCALASVWLPQGTILLSGNDTLIYCGCVCEALVDNAALTTALDLVPQKDLPRRGGRSFSNHVFKQCLIFICAFIGTEKMFKVKYNFQQWISWFRHR
ncbi:hypothetical protein CIL05_21595, partial [Virgibacillus profundi]